MREPMDLPQFTLDDYETAFADRHLLHGVVAKWAKEKPEAPALLSADGSRTVTWSEFDRITTALAGELLRLGFAKGDFLVTLLPMSVDHVLLEYSCFKIGVIVAPLDLRLSSAEVIRALEILRPRGFVGLGVKAPFDFRELWRAVQTQCPWIRALHRGGLGRGDSRHAILCFALPSRRGELAMRSRRRLAASGQDRRS